MNFPLNVGPATMIKQYVGISGVFAGRAIADAWENEPLGNKYFFHQNAVYGYWRPAVVHVPLLCFPAIAFSHWCLWWGILLWLFQCGNAVR